MSDKDFEYDVPSLGLQAARRTDYRGDFVATEADLLEMIAEVYDGLLDEAEERGRIKGIQQERMYNQRMTRERHHD